MRAMEGLVGRRSYTTHPALAGPTLHYQPTAEGADQVRRPMIQEVPEEEVEARLA